MTEKWVEYANLAGLGESLRAQHKKIVSTNGCFDLLHWGHIKYLSDAKALGDVLIVGINSDSSVKQLKGDQRPINPQDIRALQVAALVSVDYVFVFEENVPTKWIQLLKPVIHVKGGDYLSKPLPEREVVEALGGEVVCVPLVEGYSTTKILESLS